MMWVQIAHRPTAVRSISHSTNLNIPFVTTGNHFMKSITIYSSLKTLSYSTSAHDSATDFRHGNLRRLRTSTHYYLILTRIQSHLLECLRWCHVEDCLEGREGLVGTLKISSTAGSPTCKWANHGLSDLRPSFSFYLFLESEIQNLGGSSPGWNTKQALRTSARIAGGARVIISYHINMQGLQLASWGFPFKVVLSEMGNLTQIHENSKDFVERRGYIPNSM